MTDKIKPKERKLKVGIVGFTPIGDAVNHAFQVKTTETYHIDNSSVDLKLLCEWEPQAIFFCQDEYELESYKEMVKTALQEITGIVVIKTVMDPAEIDQLASMDKRVIYFPDIIKQGFERQHFLNPAILIMGGMPEPISYLEQVLFGGSNVLPCQVHRMSAVEAAFTKLAIGSFLAMKVTFFNQLYDAIDKFGGNYNTVARTIGSDYRIGISHTIVPGFDGHRGFGGKRFTGYVEKLLNFTDNDPDCDKFTLLESVLKINEQYRGDTNVDNGQAKEEQ